MNSFLFVVEGKKDEAKVLSCILKHFIGIDACRITEDTHNKNELIYESNDVYVKTIVNSDIQAFYNLLSEDQYAEGISLSSFFAGDDNHKYAQEFIIIDGDFKDRIKAEGGKKELLIKLNKFVEEMPNTLLLITTPQIEAIVDKNDKYCYNRSDKNYKNEINKRFGKGAIEAFIRNPLKYMKMNVEKYIGVEYDEQAMYAIVNYDEENQVVDIRSPLFQIISEYYFLIDTNEINEKLDELFIENWNK